MLWLLKKWRSLCVYLQFERRRSELPHPSWGRCCLCTKPQPEHQAFKSITVCLLKLTKVLPSVNSLAWCCIIVSHICFRLYTFLLKRENNRQRHFYLIPTRNPLWNSVAFDREYLRNRYCGVSRTYCFMATWAKVVVLRWWEILSLKFSCGGVKERGMWYKWHKVEGRQVKWRETGGNLQEQGCRGAGVQETIGERESIVMKYDDLDIWVRVSV